MNSSNIYSMDSITTQEKDSIIESNTVSGKNIPLVDYNDNNLPTDEQMLKYKNVLPITFNNLEKVRNVLSWLSNHQENDKKIIKEILSKIYNLSNYLSCEHCTFWGSIDDCIESYWETKYAWNKSEPRDENTTAPTEPIDDDTTKLLHSLKIKIDDINNIISVISNNGQKRLNPDKYKDFSIPQNKEISFMQALYYISNQLVQLSQDIIYNINKQIEENKDSNNILQIKSTVIDPSYKVIESTIAELKTSVNNILEKNKNAEQYKKYKKRLKHNLKQNDLNLHLDNFKTEYLDNYITDSSYLSSELKKRIFEVETKIIEMVKKQNEKFKIKTDKIKKIEIENLEKQTKKKIRELEDQTISEIKELRKQIENNINDLTEQQKNNNNKIKKQLEQKRNELSKIQSLIGTRTDFDTIVFDEIRNQLTNNHSNYEKQMLNLVKDINTNNNKITNQDIINHANEYLKTMFNTIDNCINNDIFRHSKVKNQINTYQDEMQILRDTIKEEMTKNISQYTIPESNYIENIKKLIVEYTNE